MVRPVFNLALNQIEMVGTFEQVYMGGICVDIKEANTSVSTSDFFELLKISCQIYFSNYHNNIDIFVDFD